MASAPTQCQTSSPNKDLRSIDNLTTTVAFQASEWGQSNDGFAPSFAEARHSFDRRRPTQCRVQRR